MHDIQFIRQHGDKFDAALKRRPAYSGPWSKEILSIDEKRRAVMTELQRLQARRNEASKAVGQAKAKKDEAGAAVLMAEVAGIKDKVAAGEEETRKIDAELEGILAAIPNLPADDVPDGKDEHDNKELRRHGSPRALNFAPKEHFDIGEALGQMDFDAAARMSGARFVVLKKHLAKLERAIASFMLDLHTAPAHNNADGKEIAGYTEVSPPMLVVDRAMYGTGQLPTFKDDLYQTASSFDEDQIVREVDALTKAKYGFNTFSEYMISKKQKDIPNLQLLREWASLSREFQEDRRMWLVPTAEVPLTNLAREQILSEEELPWRFTAYTPCFRQEAGAAGKDTRGMIRMHQFSKVELVSITTPEQSEAEHERMTSCAEEVLKRLGLHFRTVALCAGDMGFGARKTYDIEVWLPGQNRFREISSCSNCGDFQARRMQARYRPKGDAKGTRFVHTLNGSGLAVGRTLVAILETYQQADGCVLVPDALHPYLGMDVIAA